MRFDLYFNFKGNCAEALDFYAKIFDTKVRSIMRYSDAPPSEEYPLNPLDKDLIMYADMQIGPILAMFSDVPSASDYPGNELVSGNALTPTLGYDNKEEATRVFNALAEGGQIEMPFEPSFFAEMYGSLVDKYGFSWQVTLNANN